MTLQHRYRRHDKIAFWVTLSLSAVRRSDGTIDALIAIMTATTSRQEAAAALPGALNDG